MSDLNHAKSESDWERVAQISDATPIPYDREDGPYDPNDVAATKEYLDGCRVRHGKSTRAIDREPASTK